MRCPITAIQGWVNDYAAKRGKYGHSRHIHNFGTLSVGLLALFSGLLAAVAQNAALAPPHTWIAQQVIPVVSREPLINPGMGLYLFGTLDPADVPPDAWFTSLIPIGYFRDDWAVLEPDAEGEYRFDSYFKPIFDLWVNRLHKRVA